MPLYIVSTGAGEAKSERLVEAANSPAARLYVARESIFVGLADQKSLFRLAQAGAQIEVAGGDVTAAESEADSRTEAALFLDDEPVQPKGKRVDVEVQSNANADVE